MKRRDFLHNLAHAAAVPTLFSSLAFDRLDFSSESLLSNTLQDGNILILVRLDGGNDGLNTIIPLNELSSLNNARPHVMLPDNSIINLGQNDLGLHPKLSNFKSFFEEDRFKIIQNVGYPNPDFSHFRSMDIWQTASASDEYLNSGWMGRYVENRNSGYPHNYPNENYPHPLSVELGSQASLLFTGDSSFTSFIARNPTQFQEIINEFDNVYPNDLKGIKLKYIQLIAKQSNQYSGVIKEVYERSENQFDYPNTNFGQQMEIVGRLINGGLKTRIYMVQLGGFDTHDNQVDQSDNTKGEHANLMEELNDTITALLQNLDATGKSDKVLTMTFSEFGRTIVSNASLGTDHGTASPMMLFGNKIDPSILGNNPYIPPNAVWEDNLSSEFDFRQIYSSVINQWLGGTTTTSKEVLYRNFEQLPIILDAYIDTDNDGVANMNDNCENTLPGSAVDLTGCEIFSLPYTNYAVTAKSATCIGSKNGSISVTVTDTNHVYHLTIPQLDTTVTINGAETNKFQFDSLDVGVYTLNFSVEGQSNYLQTFEAKISEPSPLTARSKVNFSDRSIGIELSGAEAYIVEINGQKETIRSNYYFGKLRPGKNSIKVFTDLDCQGIHQESFFVSEDVRLFPNPIQKELNVVIPGTDKTTLVEVFNSSGQILYGKQHNIPTSRTFSIDLSILKPDVYVVKINGTSVSKTKKIIKQ